MKWGSPRCSSACWDEIKQADAEHKAATDSLLQRIKDLTADRDEWKKQHENLLAIYQKSLIAEEAIREAALEIEQPTKRGWYYAMPHYFAECGATDPWPHYVAESGEGALWSEKMPLNYFCWYGPVPRLKSALSPAPTRVEDAT